MGWIFGERERSLTPAETDLLSSVFTLNCLPVLSQIRVRDGLAPTGVPFTSLGASLLKRLAAYPFATSGKYLLMVGPQLFEGDLAHMDGATLVHEVTHVWQYRRRTLTELRGVATHAYHYLSGKFGGKDQRSLYLYELGQLWNEMGFEGQAQLVEDWYSVDRMSETSDRWHYVKNVIREED